MIYQIVTCRRAAASVEDLLLAQAGWTRCGDFPGSRTTEEAPNLTTEGSCAEAFTRQEIATLQTLSPQGHLAEPHHVLCIPER